MDSSPARRYWTKAYVAIAVVLLVISVSLLIFNHLDRMIFWYWLVAGVLGTVSPFVISLILYLLQSKSYRSPAILIPQLVYVFVLLGLVESSMDAVPKDLHLVAMIAVSTVSATTNILSFRLVPMPRVPRPET